MKCPKWWSHTLRKTGHQQCAYRRPTRKSPVWFELGETSGTARPAGVGNKRTSHQLVWHEVGERPAQSQCPFCGSADILGMASVQRCKSCHKAWPSISPRALRGSLRDIPSVLPEAGRCIETRDTLHESKRCYQDILSPTTGPWLSDQKARLHRGWESARAHWQSVSEKLINLPVSTFVIQLLCILLILFALVRIATGAKWLSLPWIEGWGELNIIGPIPWEASLIIMGAAGIIAISLRGQNSRTTLLSSSAIVILSIGILLAVPQTREVLFWQGANGERMEAYVKLEAVPYDDPAVVVGAKGNRIWLHNNPKAKDPTFHELEEFLLMDKTDEIPYSPDTFNCADYAEMLHNNAERAGLRAAYVVVGISQSGHALNAFYTTDRGLIYVDNTGTSGYYPCSADKLVVVEIGRPYVPKSMVPCPPFDSAWHSMGIVSSIHIQW